MDSAHEFEILELLAGQREASTGWSRFYKDFFLALAGSSTVKKVHFQAWLGLQAISSLSFSFFGELGGRVAYSPSWPQTCCVVENSHPPAGVIGKYHLPFSGVLGMAPRASCVTGSLPSAIYIAPGCPNSGTVLDALPPRPLLGVVVRGWRGAFCSHPCIPKV